MSVGCEACHDRQDRLRGHLESVRPPKMQPNTSACLRHVGCSDPAIRRQRGRATGRLRRALAATLRHRAHANSPVFQGHPCHIPVSWEWPAAAVGPSPLGGGHWGENFHAFLTCFFLDLRVAAITTSSTSLKGGCVPVLATGSAPGPASNRTKQAPQNQPSSLATAIGILSHNHPFTLSTPVFLLSSQFSSQL